MAVSGCQRGRQTAILASENRYGQIDGHFFSQHSHGNGSCARVESALTRARNIALPFLPKGQRHEGGTAGIEGRRTRKMKCAVKATSVAAFTGNASYRTNPGATYNQPFMGKSAATTITESKRA
jgi:hypothetical protein